VRYGGIEVGEGVAVVFHGAGEAVEAAEAFHLLRVVEPRGVEGATQHSERIVISSERDGKGMAVFAAMREREARRIREAGGRAVHDFRNQSERLQRARAEAFE